LLGFVDVQAITASLIAGFAVLTDPSTFRQLSIFPLPSLSARSALHTPLRTSSPSADNAQPPHLDLPSLLSARAWSAAYADLPERAVCGQLLWLRAVLSAIGITADYVALEYVSISENRTIYNLKPFPTAWLCWLLLGERFEWRVMAAASEWTEGGAMGHVRACTSDPAGARGREIASVQLTLKRYHSRRC
jgi:drug/metabolite transporter (DMT)-like permease